MPIPRLQNQASIWFIQLKDFFFLTIMATHGTTATKRNDSLTGFMMPMTSPNRIVHPVDVKNPLDRKGQNFLDNR